MKIAPSVAVVTGASSGIGAALSRQLAARGVRVGLIALPDEALDAEAERIRRQGGQAVAVAADVADRAAFGSALGQIREELGPIDLLVLNAGIGVVTPASAFSVDSIERMIRVNFLGVVNGIEAVLPEMLERGAGHLVGVSSLSSYRGQPFFSGYIASKSAVANLLEGLRIELRPKGISVTTVRPSFVRTPMTAGFDAHWLMMDAERAARIILRGIDARRSEIRFPRSHTVITDLINSLPRVLYDRVYSRMVRRYSAESSATTATQRVVDTPAVAAAAETD